MKAHALSTTENIRRARNEFAYLVAGTTPAISGGCVEVIAEARAVVGMQVATRVTASALAALEIMADLTASVAIRTVVICTRPQIRPRTELTGNLPHTHGW